MSDTFGNFCLGRLFLRPPVVIAPELNVLTVSSAECEYLFLFDCIYLSSHEVDDVGSYDSRFSSMPFLGLILLKNIEVFMTTIKKGYGVILVRKLFYRCAFLFGVIPEKAKISGDNECVSSTQLFDLRAFKASNISVSVSCNVDHIKNLRSFVQFYTAYFFLCRFRFVFILYHIFRKR